MITSENQSQTSDASAYENSVAFGPFRAVLCRFFATDEIDRDPQLKIIAGTLLLYFHMTFEYWSEKALSLSTDAFAAFNYVPVSLFQNFHSLVFMDRFQTETYLYALGMLALFGLFSLFYLRSSLVAMCLLAFLFLNKIFFYLCDFRLFTNYHHFHLLFTLVFLIASNKLRFFRLALVVSYIMAGIVKLSPSWLYGEYFNSIPDKLPLLPKWEWVAVVACAGVTALELFGPLCWFTRVRWLRRLTFGAFIVFHLYSGVIVGFWYTTLMLPLVVGAFLKFDQPLLADYHFANRHIAVWATLIVCLTGSLYHYSIPGNVRLTAEGRYFGLFMFDARHSVRFRAEIEKDEKKWIIWADRFWQDTEDEPLVDFRIRCAYYEHSALVESFYVRYPIVDGEEIIFNPDYFADARMRLFGDPYLFYYYAKELVRRYGPVRLAIRMEQKLDGNPAAVTLIDIPDFQELSPDYNPFRHNEWIQLPGPNSPSQYRWP